MDPDYTAAVAAYLRERDAAEAEIAAADRAYGHETAGLDTAARGALDAAERAECEAVDAAALVTETERTVAAAWRSLAALVGQRRTGHAPYREPAGPADAAAVRARLARAGKLLTLARQGELPIEPPRHTEVTVAGIGAGCGALAVASAARVLGAGDGALPGAVAAAVLFLGVVLAPAVSGAWLSWQYRVRPRPGHTVSCLVAALAVACALSAVFLRGM